MKKFNFSLFLSATRKVLLVAFSLALLIILPSAKLKTDNNLEMIYGTFLGSKSKYQGIIEIWNVDSFESGTNSKSSFLSQIAKSFQNKNKGLYIMVRDLSEYECANLLAKGEKPDLFSCSYGSVNVIKNYIESFSDSNFEIAQNFLDAGKVNGNQMAVAWCRGNYCLISTKAKIESAEKNGAYKSLNLENVAESLTQGKVKLSELAFYSAYDITSKNKTKHIASIGFGSSKYLMPKLAFSTYTNKGLELFNNEVIDIEASDQSQYFAYNNFIADKSTILLGTQRDIARMENRVSNGKVSDVIYEPIFAFTDLVQFMFLANSDNNLRKEYAEKFAKFLTSDSQQKQISSIGMFAVSKLQEDIYNLGVMRNITSHNIEDYTLKNIFE